MSDTIVTVNTPDGVLNINPADVSMVRAGISTNQFNKGPVLELWMRRSGARNRFVLASLDIAETAAADIAAGM